MNFTDVPEKYYPILELAVGKDLAEQHIKAKRFPSFGNIKDPSLKTFWYTLSRLSKNSFIEPHHSSLTLESYVPYSDIEDHNHNHQFYKWSDGDFSGKAYAKFFFIDEHGTKINFNWGINQISNCGIVSFHGFGWNARFDRKNPQHTELFQKTVRSLLLFMGYPYGLITHTEYYKQFFDGKGFDFIHNFRNPNSGNTIHIIKVKRWKPS